MKNAVSALFFIGTIENFAETAIFHIIL